MRALDLFSGIGGWSLGLHRHNIKTVAACESNPWKRSHYARHFPGVPIYPDVSVLTAEVLDRDGCLPIDIVVGSPPCTDISTANTSGLGVDGPESRLYFEAVRLIREIGPRWCAFENSANLRTRGADRVVAEMEAAGYAVWPLVVGAGHAGAPHRRLRSWIVGCRVDAIGRATLANTSEIGRGAGRARRSDPSLEGQQDQQFASDRARPDADSQQRRLGTISDPHTDASGIRFEPRWSSGPDRTSASEPAISLAHANIQGQHIEPIDGQVAGWRGDAESARADTSCGGGVTMPTPTARDHRSGKCSPATMADRSRPLNEVLDSGGLTDPVLLTAVYEILMGFPPGWLTPELAENALPSPVSLPEPDRPTATPSPFPSSKPSSKPSRQPTKI